MATNYRVRSDEFSKNVQVVSASKMEYAIDLVGKKWRIFEAIADYNPVSGGIIKRGTVVRRYDPDAALKEQGCIANFTTFETALEYAKRWLGVKD